MNRLALVFLIFSSISAFALPQFPPAITMKLSLSKDPDCTICHAGSPNFGNATTSFATAMKSHGLMYPDSATVATALDGMATTDSDNDGTTDLDELKAGRDPNVNDVPGTSSLSAPKYGCESTEVVTPFLFLLVVAILWRVKR